MKTLKVDDRIEVVCQHVNTRSGFRHEATLIVGGTEVDKTKVCYQNRTWEAYEFDTVIEKLLEKADMLTAEEKENFNKTRNQKNQGGIDGNFRSIAMVANLGEVFGQTKKEKNDWKLRMLKAGLEKKGLSFPENWDSLDEETKEARLDAVIGQLRGSEA